MTRAKFFIILSLAVLVSGGYGQQQVSQVPTESNAKTTTVTGILLVSDSRCNERSDNVPKDKWTCPKGSTQWGLITLEKQYEVWGSTKELKRYERRRVTVTGRVSPGRENLLDRLDVESIEPSEMPESQIRDLVEQLQNDQWTEPSNVMSPTFWVFGFTPSMRKILQAGPAAQNVLLKYVDDPQIKDHIIILLGGVGDGRAVGPIIHAMADRNEARDNAYAKKVNLVASLALTNITAADVNWHHGGGITWDKCPDDQKLCWYAWWLDHQKTFDVTKTWSRNYSNYPSYGIYQDPGLYRSDSFH